MAEDKTNRRIEPVTTIPTVPAILSSLANGLLEDGFDMDDAVLIRAAIYEERKDIKELASILTSRFGEDEGAR